MAGCDIISPVKVPARAPPAMKGVPLLVRVTMSGSMTLMASAMAAAIPQKSIVCQPGAPAEAAVRAARAHHPAAGAHLMERNEPKIAASMARMLIVMLTVFMRVCLRL